MFILAVDLEGTIIDNIFNVEPRPNLFHFIEQCIEECDHVVWFTAVKEEEAKKVVNSLIDNMFLPQKAKDIKFVSWLDDRKKNSLYNSFSTSDCFKDLYHVVEMFPGSALTDVFIVDNDRFFIKEKQKQQWISIQTWEVPYNDKDEELLIVLEKIREILFFRHMRS